jgi:polyribonucleotide 5'-hydroxyl-kinase
MAPSSALPIGASRAVSELLPLHVDLSSPSSGVLNSVLALLASTASDGEQYDEELIDLPVRGFVIVYVNHMFKASPRQ